MQYEEDLKALQHLIQEMLETCDTKNFPNLCKLQSTQQGYDRVTQMIVQLVAKEAMPIGAAIAHIEQELAHAQPDL